MSSSSQPTTAEVQPGAARRGRPRGPRRTREERREELLDAAERAIRRAGPTASMDQLASEAGITKPILYSHFGDRAGLAEALAERTSDMLIVTLASTLDPEQHGSPRDVVRSSLEAFCTFIEQEPSIYRFLVRAALDSPNPMATRLVTSIADKIAIMLGQGFRAVHADSELAEPWGLAIVGMGFVGAEWWLQNPSMTKVELVDYLTDLVWGGLAGTGLDKLQQRPPRQSRTASSG